MWQALVLRCRQSGLAVPLTDSPGHERAVPCDRELEARDRDSEARQGPREQGNYKNPVMALSQSSGVTEMSWLATVTAG